MILWRVSWMEVYNNWTYSQLIHFLRRADERIAADNDYAERVTAKSRGRRGRRGGIGSYGHHGGAGAGVDDETKKQMLHARLGATAQPYPAHKLLSNKRKERSGDHGD